MERQVVRFLAAGTLLLSLLVSPRSALAIDLPPDAADAVLWAAGDVTSALEAARVPIEAVRVTVKIAGPGKIAAEGFELSVREQDVLVTGGDSVGAMYGLLELAEQIRNGHAASTWSAVVTTLSNTAQRPFLEFRGDNPFIHCTNATLDLDVPMWRAYIDMLARSRINVLDLHGGYDLATTAFPNLLPLLVNVPEYPDIGRKDDQERNLARFKEIVAHARSRGVRVALMNYSIDVGDAFSALRRRHLMLPRDAQASLVDYTAKAVARLLREVPDLYMIGFRIGQSGAAADFHKQAWLPGIARSGRTGVRVYTRSWQTTQRAVEELARLVGGRLDVEIKFNGEHLGLPYQAIHGGASSYGYGGSYSYEGYLRTPAPYRIIWQVRANGTHRLWSWLDTRFVRRAVRSFRLGNARGFTLEPHVAYFPMAADRYYSSANGQTPYRYIWEKHWMWYSAWGRLAYNPDLPEATMVAAFEQRFGKAGGVVYQAMQEGGTVVPLVLAYRYQGPDQRDYSPETETGLLGRHRLQDAVLSPLDYARNQPMDSRSFTGIGSFVGDKIAGRPDGRIGPVRVARLLANAAAATEQRIAEVGPMEGRAADEWRLLKADLLCASRLGAYHAARILGTMHLDYALRTGSRTDYAFAVGFLGDSQAAWKRLAGIADSTYLPLDNATRRQAGYRWSSGQTQIETADRMAANLWAAVPADSGAQPLALSAADEGEVSTIATTITVTDVHPVRRGTLVEIRCRATAKAGLERAILWYKRVLSQASWIARPMREVSDSVFSVTVPLPQDGLLYLIEIQDKRGQAANFPPVLEERPYWMIEGSDGR